ncbi:MAG: CDP-alcohol phosphatidyltransferase family protein [Chloroflexota bacterium]
MNPIQTKSMEKMTLTDMLRVRTRFIIDPIVTFLARYRLSPDVLTVVGMLSHFLFAWLIALGQFQWAAVAITIISPLDALDGALARKLGRKQGGFGAFLDSTLDRLAEIILFAGFIWYYMQHGDTFMLALSYLTVTGSLMVSYTRARAEALGLSAKVGILSRVERYVVLTTFLVLNIPHVALIIMAVLTYVTVCQRMFFVWQQSMQVDDE